MKKMLIEISEIISLLCLFFFLESLLEPKEIYLLSGCLIFRLIADVLREE